MGDNDRKNMCMIQVTIPDISDDEALKVKGVIVDAIKHIDGASVDLRVRNAKVQPGAIQGGL